MARSDLVSPGSREGGFRPAIHRELELLRHLRSSGDARAIATSILRLAGLFGRLGKTSSALTLVELALRESARAFTADSYASARGFIGPGVDDRCTEAGRCLHAAGEIQRAIDLLESVAGCGSPDALVALAECHATLGDGIETLRCLDLAGERLDELPGSAQLLCRHRLLRLRLELESISSELGLPAGGATSRSLPSGRQTSGTIELPDSHHGSR